MTDVILLTKKKKQGTLKKSTLQETPLSFAQAVKYIGITPDGKLNWNLDLKKSINNLFVSYEHTALGTRRM